MIWSLPNVKFKIGHTLNVKLESEVLLTSHAHQKVKITRHEKIGETTSFTYRKRQKIHNSYFLWS